MPNKPADALKDFAKAAELNPRFLAAWQNQAHVLSDYLNEPDQALDRLDKALELNPDYALAVVGKAVIQARLGHRDDAKKAAERGRKAGRRAGKAAKQSAVEAIQAAERTVHQAAEAVSASK